MKLTQASVLGLLGATNAAAAVFNATPRAPLSKDAKWPAFDTTTLAVTTSLLATQDKQSDWTAATNLQTYDHANDPGAADILTKAAYESSPYSCFRQGFYYFPTQLYVSGTASWGGSATDTWSIASAVADKVDTTNAPSAVRAFWQVTGTQLGTDFSNEDTKVYAWKVPPSSATIPDVINAVDTTGYTKRNTAADATYTYGPAPDALGNWACCSAANSQVNCNGGFDTGIITGLSLYPTTRAMFKLDSTAGATAGDAMTTPSALDYGCQALFSTACAAEKLGTTDSAVKLLTFNNDLLLVSMYQNGMVEAANLEVGAALPATVTTKGRVVETNDQPYCDYQYNVIADKDAKKLYTVTTGSTTAGNKFNGHTKCTYQYMMGDESAAPALKITDAYWREFAVHWMEYNKSTLDTTAQIGTATSGVRTDGSTYKFGIYAGHTEDSANGQQNTLFWNPLNQASDPGYPTDKPTWYTDTIMNAEWADHKDSTMWLPGSIGKVYWVPGKAGLQKKYQISRLDAGLIGEMQALQEAQNSSYKSKLSSYNKLKDEYDEAIDKEDTRRKDFFAAGFDAPIELPPRPSAPTQPKSYSGPYLGKALETGEDDAPMLASETNKLSGMKEYFIKHTDQEEMEYLAAKKYKGVYAYHEYINGDVTDEAALKMQNRAGFMSVATQLNTGTDAQKALAALSKDGYAGRVFGRLGEGDANLPGGSKGPFAWLAPSAAAEAVGMQISFFPTDSSATGLAVDYANDDNAAMIIKMEVEPEEWATLTKELASPGGTSKAKEPADALCNAAYLAATSTAAVALALTTLF